MHSSRSRALLLGSVLSACAEGPGTPLTSSSSPASPASGAQTVRISTTVLHETFKDLDGNGDGFDVPGWTTHGSGFGLEASDASFVVENTPEGPQYARFLRVVRTPGIESIVGVDYSPYDPPAANVGQWPYLMDLHGTAPCTNNVEMLVHTRPYRVGPPDAHTEVYGVLLDYSVHGEGPTRTLTGYQLLVNGGGQTVTLSRFIRAFDHAFDYLDRYPGCSLPVPACSNPYPNPLVDGPYKGWDYRPGPFPAGGDPAHLSENVIAARYEYDPSSHAVTLRWELRRPDGSDGSPGTWDMNRRLEGDDALPPGGLFGYFATLYAGEVSVSENGLKLYDFSLTCDDSR